MASANTNFDEIITTSLMARQGTLADNVTNHNALLRILKQGGNTRLLDGGEKIVRELDFAENSTFKYYSGYEVLDIQPSDVMSAAEYDWAQAAVVVTCSGRQMRQNAGRNRTIDLVASRIKNAENTMANNISTGIYSDGTGSSGLQIGGLQLLVADVPTSGTPGNINRQTYTFWQNSEYDCTSDGTGSATAALIQGYMNELWLLCVRGSDKPDLIVADTAYFNFFWDSLQTIQRITTSDKGSSGFRSLEYNGPGGSAMVTYDDACPANHMYMLNTDYLSWDVHKDANFAAIDDRQSVNQDAVVKPIIFMGNLTMSNAALQGVLID